MICKNSEIKEVYFSKLDKLKNLNVIYKQATLFEVCEEKSNDFYKLTMESKFVSDDGENVVCYLKNNNNKSFNVGLYFENKNKKYVLLGDIDYFFNIKFYVRLKSYLQRKNKKTYY